MNDRERREIETLAYDERVAVLAIFEWAEFVLEDTPYRLSLPGLWPCTRTDEQQGQLYARGRTKPGRVVTNADGVRKRSRHQPPPGREHGTAIDCGLRYRKSGRFIWHSEAPVEAREVFLLVIDRFKRAGFRWGGDWRRFKDYNHFER